MKKKNQKLVMKPKISNHFIVKSYKYGKNLEITTASGLGEPAILVLPHKKYLVIATGEIRDMDTSAKTRKDNLNSVKQTMRKLRRLVACNFDGGDNQLWITLTFRENILDSNEAYRFFDVFMKRLRRNYDNLLYISVIEPQASGRWHFHLLLKDISGKNLFIKNSKIAELWGQGFTKTNRVKNSDNVANYLMAYLSDLEYDDNTPNSEIKSKKIQKGGRLHLYPKGIRIYRASRNVSRPIEITASKGEIMEYYEVAQSPDFVKESIHLTENKTEIKYITEYYNDI